MPGRAEYGKYIMDINIMKKHLLRLILIACDTIITRVQGLWAVMCDQIRS